MNVDEKRERIQKLAEYIPHEVRITNSIVGDRGEDGVSFIGYPNKESTVNMRGKSSFVSRTEFAFYEDFLGTIDGAIEEFSHQGYSIEQLNGCVIIEDNEIVRVQIDLSTRFK